MWPRTPRGWDLRRTGCLGVAIALLGGSGLRAHTRERDRIAAFEESQEKRNALLNQGMKDALDGVARLEEALQGRVAHAEHLGSQIDALRSDVTAGLGKVVGSVTAAMAPALQSMEERFQERLVQQDKARGETEEKLRAAAVASQETRLATEATVRERETLALRTDLDQHRAALEEFRGYLKKLSEAFETRFARLGEDLASLRKQQADDQARIATRFDTLLKVVNEENLKLRKGLEQVAAATGGGVAPSSAGPGIHVVQKGESLYGIARQYGIDLDVLKKANPELAAPDAVVHPGAKVRLPGR